MKKQVKTEFLRWYSKNKRTMPWRRTKDPYKILVSEIMLQQTTVRVVIPYYERFLKLFPTAKALASAKEEDVLGAWAGLGYYSRARNLQKATKEVKKRGSFPKTYHDLLTLPGIGPYTAAAVASISFGEAVPAIDGNVIRVLTRLYDLDSDVTRSETKKTLFDLGTKLIEGQPPDQHNQAMMELGATICTPTKPSCLLCPFLKVCQSQKKGNTHLRPLKKPRKPQEPWAWDLFLVEKKGMIALVKGENGSPWLKNTYVLPGATRKLKNKPSKSAFTHSITHHKIFGSIEKKGLGILKNYGPVKWVPRSKIDSVGVSSVVFKAIKSLSGRES